MDVESCFLPFLIGSADSISPNNVLACVRGARGGKIWPRKRLALSVLLLRARNILHRDAAVVKYRVRVCKLSLG